MWSQRNFKIFVMVTLFLLCLVFDKTLISILLSSPELQKIWDIRDATINLEMNWSASWIFIEVRRLGEKTTRYMTKVCQLSNCSWEQRFLSYSPLRRWLNHSLCQDSITYLRTERSRANWALSNDLQDLLTIDGKY